MNFSLPNATQISHVTIQVVDYGIHIPVVGVVIALFQKIMKLHMESLGLELKNMTPFQAYLHQKSDQQVDAELRWSLLPLYGPFKIAQMRNVQKAELTEKQNEQNLIDLKNAHSSRLTASYDSAIATYQRLINDPQLGARAQYDLAITTLLKELSIPASCIQSFGLSNLNFRTSFSAEGGLGERGLGTAIASYPDLSTDNKKRFLQLDIDHLPKSKAKGWALYEKALIEGYVLGQRIENEGIAKLLQEASDNGISIQGGAYEMGMYHLKSKNFDQVRKWMTLSLDKEDPSTYMKAAQALRTQIETLNEAGFLFSTLQDFPAFKTVAHFNCEVAKKLVRIRKLIYLPTHLNFPEQLPPDTNVDRLLLEADYYLTINEKDKAHIALQLGDWATDEKEKLKWYSIAKDTNASMPEGFNQAFSLLTHRHSTPAQGFQYFNNSSANNRPFLNMVFQGLYEMSGRGQKEANISLARIALEGARDKKGDLNGMASYYLKFASVVSSHQFVLVPLLNKLYLDWTAEPPTDAIPSLPAKMREELLKEKTAQQTVLNALNKFLKESPFASDNKMAA